MENEKGIVKLTRKQLYDEIWALSVAGVARKYNLNYGKLIATCKVENISFPSSGYWTKKNMGKDVSNEIVEFSGLEDTEISLITKDAVVKRIRKAKAEVVEKVHTDVTEELVRLSSHFSQFEGALSKEGQGRKLDFISQEFLREFNTIASKAQDGLIQAFVVEAKTEVEKLKEQLQNIE